jgi:hypothetical protein
MDIGADMADLEVFTEPHDGVHKAQAFGLIPVDSDPNIRDTDMEDVGVMDNPADEEHGSSGDDEDDAPDQADEDQDMVSVNDSIEGSPEPPEQHVYDEYVNGMVGPPLGPDSRDAIQAEKVPEGGDTGVRLSEALQDSHSGPQLVAEPASSGLVETESSIPTNFGAGSTRQDQHVHAMPTHHVSSQSVEHVEFSATEKVSFISSSPVAGNEYTQEYPTPMETQPTELFLSQPVQGDETDSQDKQESPKVSGYEDPNTHTEELESVAKSPEAAQVDDTDKDKPESVSQGSALAAKSSESDVGLTIPQWLPPGGQENPAEPMLSFTFEEVEAREQEEAELRQPSPANDQEPSQLVSTAESQAKAGESHSQAVDELPQITEKAEERTDQPSSEAEAAEGLSGEVEEETAGVKRITRARTARKEKQSGKETSEMDGDPSIQLARAALASRKASKKLPDIAAPRSPMKTRARSSSVRMSPTPEVEDASVQLAKAGLASPSRRSFGGENGGSPSMSKSELVKRLRTELPQYTSLKSLRGLVRKEIEVVAVATTPSTAPQRTKQREYAMSFNITDAALAPNDVVEVQFFRAHKDFLPALKPGDSLLLRNFTVISIHEKKFGLRTHDSSSWAVFETSDSEPEVKGPPIEIDESEATYALALRSWFSSLDKAARQKLDEANQRFLEAEHA